MSQQNPIQEQIIAKAMKEEIFRQKLLSNPKAAIERAFRLTIPQDVTIVVHQDTPTTLHLVLPRMATGQGNEVVELSDADLQEVGGGLLDWLWPATCDSTYSCSAGGVRG